MQRLKGIYPEYADEVDFYAVGVNPTVDVSRLEAYRVEQGHPWPVAQPMGNAVRDFDVRVQSTKVAFNSQGVIIYREGFGTGGGDDWHGVFKELAEIQ